MKSIFLPTIALFAAVPAVAHAEEAKQRFEHDGRVYSYTVAQADGYRVITGIEEKTGKEFKLRVGENRVRGTVGSQQVSFPLRDVAPLTKVTVLASR